MQEDLKNFEAGAGRLARVLVENATAPVKDAGLTLLDSLFSATTRLTLGLLIKAVAALAAMLFLVLAVGCACVAGYMGLAALIGPAPAFLVIAVVFLILAVVMVVVAAQTRLGASVAETAAVTEVMAPAFEAPRTVADDVAPPEAQPASAAEPPFEPGLLGSAEALSTVLGTAGLDREQAGVQAGLALARRLTPLQLAVVGAAVAFAAGRRLAERRAAPKR